MPNPNNNMNMYNQALQINRALKKENDALSEIIDEVENYFLNVNTGWEDEVLSTRKIQDMIDNIRSRDGR